MKVVALILGFFVSTSLFADSANTNYRILEAKEKEAEQELSEALWSFSSVEEKREFLASLKNSRQIFTQDDIDRVMGTPLISETERFSRIDVAEEKLKAIRQAKKGFIPQAIARLRTARERLSEARALFTSEEEKNARLREWKNSRTILTKADRDRVLAAPIVTEKEKEERIASAQREFSEAIRMRESIPTLAIVRAKVEGCWKAVTNLGV